MRILIAGIGNIFFGDDAFGVEVVRELLQRELPPEVRADDFGIRSYDLAYAMMDGYDATILIDATQRGKAPGTLYLIEPEPGDVSALEFSLPDAHSMDAVAVLRMVKNLGGEPSKLLYLVGCEPANLEPDDCQFGLSEIVQNAIPAAVEMVETLLRDLLRDHASAAVPAKGGEEHVMLQ
jgi:hydrogenase maturation protease